MLIEMHIPHDIEAVVLANGDYPFADVPFQLLKRAPYVVCCDGGANEYIERGCLPDIIIGDGDSLSETNQLKYADLIFHNPDQETNDQTKAVQYLLSKGKRKIAIVGATGKREDHTIGNVSLLIEYMRMGAEVRSYTDYGVFVPCKDTCVFECRPGQQVSIFNFTAKGLKSKGLAYPIYDFTSWWQGTLNRCTDASFTIEAEGEYLVFLNYI
jgi:thiamine pyrophosphokinase